MNYTIRRIILSVTLASLTLGGCGSSDGTPDSTFAVSRGTIAKSVAGVSGQQITGNNSIRVRHIYPNHGHAEFEGLVTDYEEANGIFTLNGQQIQLTPATIYSHGAVSEIANGVKVEIKGNITNGILVAQKVKIDGDHGLPVLVPMTPPAPVTLQTPLTPPIPVPLLGKSLYDASCSGCHVLGTYDSSGFAPNLTGKGGVVVGKLTGGHKGISMSTQQLTDVVAFVNAN